MQKHRARRPHYDFRLELEGVLKSWAVPKAPSMDPTEKRLAVRTEDHPLEYANFEGVIPKGEYGAGSVMLWDRGTWKTEEDPLKALEAGKLKFDLDGQILHGRFVLVRVSAGPDAHENWLLIKEKDDRAFSYERDRRVSAGTQGQEAAAKPSVQPAGKRAKRRNLALPRFRPPQLATQTEKAPSGEQWAHEIKFDGYRLISAVAGAGPKLFTRSGLDWTAKFKSLAEALAALEVNSALLDGEVVVLDSEGRSSFARLQKSLKEGENNFTYVLFDLLEVDGDDISEWPLAERKARLSRLLLTAPERLVYSDHIVGDGLKVLAEACRLGLEGVISKRLDSPYRSRRTLSWLKTKCTGIDEFVIGGWRPSSKLDRPFASLLVGEFEDGKLRYRGRVGAGFDTDMLADMFRKLKTLSRKDSPFVNAPAAVARFAKWVQPRLVAQIKYSERTKDGYLRQPVFMGLREDKKAADVKAPAVLSKEVSSRTEISGGASLRLTHPEKILYPNEGLTKEDLAAYWRDVSQFALPHISGRPLSLVRCPEGSQKECFFQRHFNPAMPRAIIPVPIARNGEDPEKFIAINTREGLEATVQIGALELHLWGAHVSTIEQPDRLVFDLDPDPSVSFDEVRRAATDIRDLLEAADLKSFVMLTGGKGLHVIVPLEPSLGWEEFSQFAKGFATRLAADDPFRFTAVMSKARRKNKIYIDYLRNERAASAIAPYSPRAREFASVAAPLAWEELETVSRADFYMVDEMRRRVKGLAGKDPWAGYFDLAQKIPRAALRMFSERRAL